MFGEINRNRFRVLLGGAAWISVAAIGEGTEPSPSLTRVILFSLPAMLFGGILYWRYGQDSPISSDSTVQSPIIFWLLKVPLLVGIVLVGWFLVALIGVVILGIQPGRVNGLQAVLLGGGGLSIVFYGNRIANQLLRRFRPEIVKVK